MKASIGEDSPLLAGANKSKVDTLDTADENFAITHGMDVSEKSIGLLGSFVLVANNIAGPGLMTLPIVFQEAGIVPTVTCIVVMCICSSFSGTLISEVIQSLPGNANFDLNIEYSALFDLVMGAQAYYVAETFFISACMVQACTGLVETAQSLDSFLASYLLGETYGLQIWPSVEFRSWSPDPTVLASEEVDAAPFDDAGPLVITAGYLLVTLLFFPLGRGHLKETMVVQVISFVCLIVLLTEFDVEFFLQGLKHSVPWFGTSYSQLIGVIVFNYAFVITVPAWLIEKVPSVNVTTCIWTASIFSSLLYVVFGLMAAMAYHKDAQDMLTILAGQSVHGFTRVCAAFFGVTIIGAGVPVFCVIIKNTLFATRACNSQTSFFWGSVFPYLVSWVLYQGSALMNVLNWTGLIVNGGVAFVFPLVVCGIFFAKQVQVRSQPLSPTHVRTVVSPTLGRKSDHAETGGGRGDLEMSYSSLSADNDSSRAGKSTADVEPAVMTTSLPSCLLPYRDGIINTVIILFSFMIVATVVMDVVTGSGP